MKACLHANKLKWPSKMINNASPEVTFVETWRNRDTVKNRDVIVLL